MSNLILKFESLFESLFENVASSLNGDYQSDNEEIIRLRQKIKEDSFIPSSREDRKNLSNDVNNVSKDYKKSLDYYHSDM